MTPDTFTIASWNGTNPETFTDFHLARAAAIARAASHRIAALQEEA